MGHQISARVCKSIGFAPGRLQCYFFVTSSALDFVLELAEATSFWPNSNDISNSENNRRNCVWPKSVPPLWTVPRRSRILLRKCHKGDQPFGWKRALILKISWLAYVSLSYATSSHSFFCSLLCLSCCCVVSGIPWYVLPLMASQKSAVFPVSFFWKKGIKSARERAAAKVLNSWLEINYPSESSSHDQEKCSKHGSPLLACKIDLFFLPLHVCWFCEEKSEVNGHLYIWQHCLALQEPDVQTLGQRLSQLHMSRAKQLESRPLS